MRWSIKSKQCIDKSVWHKWFAWHPVCIRHHAGGGRDMVWWEQVNRKGKYIGGKDGWDYKYKLLNQEKSSGPLYM